MRIQPLHAQSELRQASPAVERTQKPSSIAVQPKYEKVATSDNDDTPGVQQSLYELRLAQPLPPLILSRTPASTLLSSRQHDRLEAAMPALTPATLVLFCTSIICFVVLSVVAGSSMTPWVPLIFVTFVLPLLSAVAFLSLDVLAQLLRNYEFWFISTLNALNFLGLGLIFGDERAVVCVALCLNVQSVVAIDANYRHFPAAVKSIVVAGPAMLALVVCCAYRLLADSEYPALPLGGLVLQSRQVVIFTASTLSVFLIKKSYVRQRHRSVHPGNEDRSANTLGARHTIPCVVLQARIRLNPVAVQACHSTNQENTSPLVSTMPEVAAPARPHNTAGVPHIQQLQLSNDKTIVVDACRTIVRPRLLRHFETSFQLRAALYWLGAIGLAATVAAWVLLLRQRRRKASEQLELVLGIIAVVFSLLFTSTTIALTQRNLLRLLAWNFDVVFSAVQGTALAVCLLDLLCWRAAPCLAVISWWLWFHWLLVLDALTPSVTHHLRLRRFFALPAILLALVIASVCALQLLIDDSEIFSSRLLWRLSVTSIGDFDVHTSTLAVQRVVTIMGWSARLVIELVVSDQNQLLYIRRHVEYVSPYATFMDAPSSGAQKRRTCQCSRSQTSALDAGTRGELGPPTMSAY